MSNIIKYNIIKFAINNENTFCRTNEIVKKFRKYIYDDSGSIIDGGQDVQNFIHKIDGLMDFIKINTKPNYDIIYELELRYNK